MGKQKQYQWLPKYIAYIGCHLTLCVNSKQFGKLLEDSSYEAGKHKLPKWLNNDIPATIHRLTNHANKKQKLCVVCLNDENCTPIQVAGLLIHEAVHVFQFECEDIGEDNPSNEYEAYAIQQIAETLMEEYVRLTT